MVTFNEDEEMKNMLSDFESDDAKQWYELDLLGVEDIWDFEIIQ